MYIIRFSNHINEDMQRNWSSWNYGQEGLNCTEEKLEAIKENAIANNEPIFISGFELWGDEIANSDIRELYPNYWVLVDTTRGEGLSCSIIPNAETTEQAIAAFSNGFRPAMEEGETVYCGEGSQVVFTCPNNEYHIIKVKN